jgi:hypothetical protein
VLLAHGVGVVRVYVFGGLVSPAGNPSRLNTDERKETLDSQDHSQVIMLATEELPIRCAVAQVPEIGPTGPNLSEATVAAVTTAISEGRRPKTSSCRPDHRDRLSCAKH